MEIKRKIKSLPGIMQPVPSLKSQAALVLSEAADYDLNQLMRAIETPQNDREFAISQASHADEFWLMVDTNYCEGHLISWRTDVPPEKWRSFVEGFIAKRVFIYTVKCEFDHQVPFLTIQGAEAIVGERNSTYTDVARRLHEKTMRDGLEESGIQYVGIQLTNLEATVGCYGFVWGLSYSFHGDQYSDNLPRRTCLFKSEAESLEAYDKMIDNLASNVRYVCLRNLDFDVPADSVGFIRVYGPLIPSSFSLPEIKAHLLEVFSEEDPINLSIFSDDGTLRTFEYMIYAHNTMPDEKCAGLDFFINISQLRF